MKNHVYRLLLLGDFAWGESYNRGGASILSERGYMHSVEHLIPFINRADHTVINLETPIVDPVRFPSPLDKRKTYLHWADTDATPRTLREIGVDAVGLANNHTMDHGTDGLKSTFEHLSRGEIPWFGAGLDMAGATRPHRVSLPTAAGGGIIELYATYQYSRAYDRLFGFFASDETPGCAPLSPRHVIEPATAKTAPKPLRIAFPHWGSNYQWRSPSQHRIGNSLLDKGYDLVVGHGAHSVQEIERRRRRWMLYSIGNSHFLSVGRFAKYAEANNILPLGFWSMLEVESSSLSRAHVRLKLYPVYLNNIVTDYQPHPVNETDFHGATTILGKAATARPRFDNDARTIGQDDLGRFIQLDLGEWTSQQTPRLAELDVSLPLSDVAIDGPSLWPSQTTAPNGTPGEENHSDIESLVSRQQRTGRTLSAILISDAAARSGAEVTWLTRRVAIASANNNSVLLPDYQANQSVVGQRIARDHLLSRRLLQEAGIPLLPGRLVRTADEAVDFFLQQMKPVTVKAIVGSGSQILGLGTRTTADVAAAFERAVELGGAVLVEDYIHGTTLQCLSTDTQCISVLAKLPLNVKGDGRSTVTELIHRENELRADAPGGFCEPVSADASARDLQNRGIDLQYIPEAGTDVRIPGTVRQVSQSTVTIPDIVKRAASRSIAAIPGLHFGEVVIQVRQPATPYVVGINVSADVVRHSSGARASRKCVGERIWSLYLKSSTEITSASSQTPSGAPISRTPITPSHIGGVRDSVGLSRTFAKELELRGYEIDYLERESLLKVTDSHGAVRWFYRGLGVADLATVHGALRHHGIVRRMLRLCSVPRVVGRRIHSYDALHDFLERPMHQAVATPTRQPWGSSDTMTFSGASEVVPALFSEKRSWIVQTRPPGSRLRVYANRANPLAILGDPDAMDDLTDPTLTTAGRVAVSAVRAIPGLRWSAVDILARTGTRRPTTSNPALVEGIIPYPHIRTSDREIVGSMTQVYDFLLSNR